jgi:phosphoribosyl-ATP pyrophosphohydrolase
MAAADPSADDVLARLAATIAARRGGDPSASYVAALFAMGNDAILKKIGEEATETVLAAKDGAPDRITAEVADLWFHCVVLLVAHGLTPADVLKELARREGTSGHVEKSRRGGAPPGPAR